MYDADFMVGVRWCVPYFGRMIMAIVTVQDSHPSLDPCGSADLHTPRSGRAWGARGGLGAQPCTGDSRTDQ